MASNEASNKVALKCGFIKEGFIRQGKFIHMYANYNLYGLLRSDLYEDSAADDVRTEFSGEKTTEYNY